jgi:exopolysaccharide biosynthesis protein
MDTHGAYCGLSGFYALLIDGRNNGGMKDRHPRSAVGISRNGRYLILMAIDGRQPGYSESASTGETAEWIRKLGAYNALNLDGGGSTALVIEGPDGAPVVLNRPSGPPPGVERRVANHLGVFAQRLVADKPLRR